MVGESVSVAADHDYRRGHIFLSTSDDDTVVETGTGAFALTPDGLRDLANQAEQVADELEESEGDDD